jgi:hypothetical protein
MSATTHPRHKVSVVLVLACNVPVSVQQSAAVKQKQHLSLQLACQALVWQQHKVAIN